MNKVKRFMALFALMAMMLQVVTLPVSAQEESTDESTSVDSETTTTNEAEESDESDEEGEMIDEMIEEVLEELGEGEESDLVDVILDGIMEDIAEEEQELMEDMEEMDEEMEELEEEMMEALEDFEEALLSYEEEEEFIDDLLDEVDDDDEAEEALEDFEEETEEMLEELEEALEDAETEEERMTIKELIQQRKKLLRRIRVNVLQNHSDIVDKVKKVRAAGQLYSIEWGVLDGRTKERCGLTKEKIREALENKERPECESEKMEYEGSLSVNQGELMVKKPLLFEKNDNVSRSEGSEVEWTSHINGHKDGLVVEFAPNEAADGDVEITLSLGSLEKTFMGEEIFGKHDIGNDHQVYVKPLLKANAVKGAVRTKLLENKAQIQEKLGNVRQKVRDFELLNDTDEATDNIEELEALLEEIEAYNFDDTSSDELENELDDLFLNFEAEASNRKTASNLDSFRAKFKAIKAGAKLRKFEEKLIPFKDTDDNEWYTTFVAPMKDRGIISGFKDADGNDIGEYRPGNNVTVAETLKIALGSAGEETSEGTPKLSRALNHWAKAYVKRAEELSLDVVNDGELDLNRNATRAEVVRIMLEAAGVDPAAVSSTDFSDLPTSHEHAKFVQLAKDLGIVSGDDGTTNFRPDEPINRAEVAKIANQILEVLLGEAL